MFENATDQQQADSSADNLGFVTAVRDCIVGVIPELADDSTLHARIEVLRKKLDETGQAR